MGLSCVPGGAAAALLLLAACGGGETSAAQVLPEVVRDKGAPQAAQQLERQGFPAQIPRADSPALARAVAALELADAAAASQALLALGDDLDGELLRARLSALEGDGIDAVRRLERARVRWPDQSRVFATAAEIHAQAGRLESAEAELREGLERCGPTPDCSRARGVLALARAGGARVALNHLLDARAIDPSLPFLTPALYSAHLLLGRAALTEGLAVDATGHARAGLLLAPGDREARTLLADAQASTGDFDSALQGFEGLLAEGAPVRDTLALLCQRAGTAALVEGRREVAVGRHMRARELGLSADELGFGATLLASESAAALERGIAAYGAGDWPGAALDFERALALDPDSLSVHNHLGVVRFRQARYADAARHWSDLLARARAEGIELPEPVELNLARALALDGRAGAARTLLEGWLAGAPAGREAELARELLGELDGD